MRNVELALVAMVAFGASTLTFFSGFGLGTVLLPAFALFLPTPAAVAATAIVHFLNNALKLGLEFEIITRDAIDFFFGTPDEPSPRGQHNPHWELLDRRPPTLDRLAAAIHDKGSAVCVGIDPRVSQLPAEFQPLTGLAIGWLAEPNALPEKLRETAYALACDVVAADQTVTREEARLLDLLRYELQIGKLVAAAIERGARARHLTL